VSPQISSISNSLPMKESKRVLIVFGFYEGQLLVQVVVKYECKGDFRLPPPH